MRRSIKRAIASAKKKIQQPLIWQINDPQKYPPLVGVPIDRSRLQSHVLYHVMPIHGETEWVWRRHLQWIREVRHEFSGRLIVGIVTPGASDHYTYFPPEAVKEELVGLDAEFISAPNDVGVVHRRGIGEGVLFPIMLDRLKTSDPDEVFFYGHCKGVTRPGPVDSVPNRWAEAMFDVLFRNHDEVVCALDNFGVCGSFLMRGGFRPGLPGVGPHYFFSGTFFAMRLIDVFQRDWKALLRKIPHYGCVEQLPRLLFKLDAEVACLLMDGVANLYDEHYWISQVQPAIDAWRQEKFRSSFAVAGGHRMRNRIANA